MLNRLLGTAVIPVANRDTPISIYAPCEGGDSRRKYNTVVIQISIHAPREGGDHMRERSKNIWICKFQSTPPARGAT